MRVERCKCNGNDPDCYECEGCGEVAIYTAAEVKEMRAKLERARIPDPTAPLTPEQQKRFVDIACKPGVFIRDVDAPPLEQPALRDWQCGACGNVMTRALQPETCCKCGVRFLYS